MAKKKIPHIKRSQQTNIKWNNKVEASAIK